MINIVNLSWSRCLATYVFLQSSGIFSCYWANFVGNDQLLIYQCRLKKKKCKFSHLRLFFIQTNVCLTGMLNGSYQCFNFSIITSDCSTILYVSIFSTTQEHAKLVFVYLLTGRCVHVLHVLSYQQCRIIIKNHL